MEKNESDILIIGAGLTGLALAYLLGENNLKINIVEARNRLGGRIHTLYPQEAAPIEAGATWLGQKHRSLIHLLEDLDLDIYEQILGDKAIYEPISTSPHQIVSLPPNTDPSFRIKGGTSMLINTLFKKAHLDNIYLGQTVKSVSEKEGHLEVITEKSIFAARIVISTIPPNLLRSTVAIQPSLPESIYNLASQTHTWMGESIKIGFRYKQPFWREKNLSGTIVSNVGPISEMYDHSNFEESFFALKGFLNSSYYSVSKEERLAIILNQLRKYYGQLVEEYISYEEVVWRKERFTYIDHPSHILPHQNNGHSAYQEALLNGKFFIAGSETADQYPGYMEGAIRSAMFIKEQLETLL